MDAERKCPKYCTGSNAVSVVVLFCVSCVDWNASQRLPELAVLEFSVT